MILTKQVVAKQEPTLLVVDDDADLSRWLDAHLSSAGYDVVHADRGSRALSEAKAHLPDCVLLDCVLPDTTGLSLIEPLHRINPQSTIIVMTANTSLDDAVQAVKRGAYHYCAKPLQIEGLIDLVGQAIAHCPTSAEGAPTLDDLLGESPAMQRVKQLLGKIVSHQASSTLLLCGETGTGKDLIARIIHNDGSRASAPFINVTCSAIPGGLSESELFGHERGAFTDAKEKKHGLVELAEGGTLFLDEVGELSKDIQGKLLRFLEERVVRRVGGVVERHVDVRVIAATNRELEKMVRKSRFREDLFYRLAVVVVTLPPLRQRAGDVRLLSDAFLQRYRRAFGRPEITGFTGQTLDALENHRWPGNVRQLRNTVERAVLLADGPLITEADLPTWPDAEPLLSLPAKGIHLEVLERQFIQEALRRRGGNQTKAAQLLGMTRDQLRYRIEKYKLR